MELHSYAKRRVSKKWTLEQKRKLVESRIKFDVLFANKPAYSIIPWKKVLTLAKLDDFNVFFVRKQWANMISKYKQLKQTRIGNMSATAIDDKMLRLLSQEWEFFQQIHAFMTRKTTNLHSYALATAPDEATNPLKALMDAQLSPNAEQCVDKPEDEPEIAPYVVEPLNIYSSDTNEMNDYMVESTDHDYIDKQLNYFADEDTKESNFVEVETVFNIKAEKNGEEEQPHVMEQDMPGSTEEVPTMPSALPNGNTDPENGQQKPKQSEREKYYRHKRRFNHRLEQRFDAILNVFGQIVKAEYPSIDVSPLLGAVATAGNQIYNTFRSSDEEDSNESLELQDPPKPNRF